MHEKTGISMKFELLFMHYSISGVVGRERVGENWVGILRDFSFYYYLPPDYTIL